jgi:hypothetical protein
MKDLLNSDWLSVNFYLDKTNTYEIVHPFQEDGAYMVSVQTEDADYQIKFIYFNDCFMDKFVKNMRDLGTPLRFGTDQFESVTVEDLTLEEECIVELTDEQEKQLYNKLMQVK